MEEKLFFCIKSRAGLKHFSEGFYGKGKNIVIMIYTELENTML